MKDIIIASKKGHYFYECIYRKRNNKYKRKYFRKSKNEQRNKKNTKTTSQVIIQKTKNMQILYKIQIIMTPLMLMLSLKTIIQIIMPK